MIPVRYIQVRIFIVPLLLLAFVAEARMYQWTDPDTGTTQLSGKPPAWYRSQQIGPRVFVFEKNRIVDDTAIDVSNEKRESLRQQALLKAEESREAARKKALAAEELKKNIGDRPEPGASGEESFTEMAPATEPEQVTEAAPEDAPPPRPVSDEEATMQELKELIQDWEEQQEQQARERLQSQGEGSY